MNLLKSKVNVMNIIYINQLKQDFDGQEEKSKPFFMTFLLILMTLGLASISHAKAPINTALETVESYLNIWNGTQPDDLTKVLDTNVEYFNTSNEENRKGTASVIEVPKFLLTVIPDRKMTLTSPPLIVGDKVAVEWQLQGTLNKKDQSGKKDAKVITFKGASFFEVKNNKITYIGDYYNNHPLRSQLEP
jgi:hypothetical protein